METKCKKDEVITETINRQERGSGQPQSSLVRSSLSPVRGVLKQHKGKQKVQNTQKLLIIFISIVKRFSQDQRVSQKHPVVGVCKLFKAKPKPIPDEGIVPAGSLIPGTLSPLLTRDEHLTQEEQVHVSGTTTDDEVDFAGTGALTSPRVGTTIRPQQAKGVKKQKPRPTQRKPGCKQQARTDPPEKVRDERPCGRRGSEGTAPITLDLRCVSLLPATGPCD